MKTTLTEFSITNKIIDLIAEISQLVGQISVTIQMDKNPMLRRKNRINTIYGSLAIEQNTLTIEQITAVINGKRVLAPPKDIEEVKNAFEIYSYLDTINPYSVEALDALSYIAVRLRYPGRSFTLLTTASIPLDVLRPNTTTTTSARVITMLCTKSVVEAARKPPSAV